MNNYQPVNADRSKVENCCGCINMYSGFKCLAWLQAIFSPLGFLGCCYAFVVFMSDDKSDIIKFLYNGEDINDFNRRTE